MTTTQLVYRTVTPDHTGPAGTVRAYSCPVEIVSFDHARYGIRSVRVRKLDTPPGTRALTWTVAAFELDDLHIEQVAS